MARILSIHGKKRTNASDKTTRSRKDWQLGWLIQEELRVLAQEGMLPGTSSTDEVRALIKVEVTLVLLRRRP